MHVISKCLHLTPPHPPFLSSPLGWSICQRFVPGGGRLGQEQLLSGGSWAHADGLSHPYHPLQACGEPQENGKEWVVEFFLLGMSSLQFTNILSIFISLYFLHFFFFWMIHFWFLVFSALHVVHDLIPCGSTVSTLFPCSSVSLVYVGIYLCPCYYFPVRSGGAGRASFVVGVELKSGAVTPDHWIKRGTALLMSLDN